MTTTLEARKEAEYAAETALCRTHSHTHSRRQMAKIAIEAAAPIIEEGALERAGGRIDELRVGYESAAEGASDLSYAQDCTMAAEVLTFAAKEVRALAKKEPADV